MSLNKQVSVTENMEKLKFSYTADRIFKNCSCFGNSLALPQNVKQLPHDPEIPHLGVHPRELKAFVYTEISVQMFIVALFMIAKMWKQSKCLLPDYQINNEHVTDA